MCAKSNCESEWVVTSLVAGLDPSCDAVRMKGAAATAVSCVAYVLGVYLQTGFTATTSFLLVGLGVIALLCLRHRDALDSLSVRLERLVTRRGGQATRSWKGRQRRRVLRFTALAGLVAVVAFAAGAVTGRAWTDLRADERLGDHLPTARSTVNDMDLQLAVGNVTAGDQDYRSAVSALVDDVVQFHLTYRNDAKVDRGLAVRFRTSEPHDAEQLLTVDVDVDGERSELSVPVSLSSPASALALVAGTIEWRHATPEGPETETIQDAFGPFVDLARVSAGSAGSVSVLARAQARSVSIKLLAASQDNPGWAAQVRARAGEEVQLEAVIGNEGNLVLRDLVVRANLAPGVRQVPGSTLAMRGGQWQPMGDEIVNEVDPTGAGGAARVGLRVGDLDVGAELRVRWTVRLDQDRPRKYCMVAAVLAVGSNEYYNVAVLGVETEPSPCRARVSTQPGGTFGDRDADK